MKKKDKKPLCPKCKTHNLNDIYESQGDLGYTFYCRKCHYSTDKK